MRTAIVVAVSLLSLVLLFGSLVALLFRNLRQKAKWMTLASVIGFILSVGLLEESQDQDARDHGFINAEDQRAAKIAAVADSTAWRQQRVQEAEELETKLKRDAAELESKRARDAEVEAQLCAEELRCTAEKNNAEATVRCIPFIERLAKNNFDWIDRWYEPKLTHFRWKDKKRKLVTYFGDKIKYQNGFGAWIISIYECDFDTTAQIVTDVRAYPGRLPE